MSRLYRISIEVGPDTVAETTVKNASEKETSRVIEAPGTEMLSIVIPVAIPLYLSEFGVEAGDNSSPSV